MSKPIYERLIDDSKFRSMWANAHIDQDDMHHLLGQKYSCYRGDLDEEINLACKVLDGQMKRYFLKKFYK